MIYAIYSSYDNAPTANAYHDVNIAYRELERMNSRGPNNWEVRELEMISIHNPQTNTSSPVFKFTERYHQAINQAKELLK